MGAGSTTKRRRTGTDSSANSATPSRAKPAGTGRGRGRPPNAPRDGRERPPPLGECFRKRCGDILDRLSKKDHYNIFLEPVNTDDVAGYAETIKRPMDFTTIRTKLASQEGSYKSLGEFRRDLDLIWSNCLLFNGKEPTNIFSKKAIELRRLTEKLIVTTRQHLEKDKENINKWKEKHRRRKETMQANAANSSQGLNPSIIPGAPPFARGPRSHANAAVRDPMDTSTHGFPAEEHNGRTPEQIALADSLRLQYSGTTGLYRKSTANAPFPQYTTADGTVVPIPVRRYQPRDDHWDDGHAGNIAMLRIDACPTLLCESLPMCSTTNPCAPQPRTGFILVKDYAESLYRFVKDAGPIGIQIVTELLSPELTVKKQQDEILKKGLSLKDLATKARTASLRTSPGKKWDGDAIIQLADEIERANRRVVSILPKLPRSIPELDGISGLGQLLGKDIIKEVEAVPAQVIDYAMPHGVSLQTMSEICRLGTVPALGISQKDLQCIDFLRKQAQDHTQHIGPDAAAKMTGASVLTPSDLHEVQLRALLMRQQRRMEAGRQADLIEQTRRGVSGSRSNDLSVLEKRELELSAQNQKRIRVPDMRTGSRPPAQPNASVLAQSKAETMMKAKLAHQAAMAAVKASSLGLNQQQNNRGNRAPTMIGSALAQRVVNSLPPADRNAACRNCGTRETPGWRAGGMGPDGVERLCIPCGLYWERTQRHRPKDMWGQTSLRRSRIPSSSSISNGINTPRAVVNPQPAISHTANLNGVAKRPIQKTAKTPQSSPNRSPSSSASRAKAVKSRLPVAPISFVPGARPIQAAQPITSVQNTFGGPSRMQNVGQLYTAQGSNLEARNTITPQNMQPLHISSGLFTGGASSGVNNGVHTNLNTQQQVQASMSQLMYRGQQPASGILTSQQLMSMGSHTQASLIAAQNSSLMQQKMMSQQLSTAQAGISNGVNAFAPQMQRSKNSSMMMDMNGNIPQNIAPHSQFSMMQSTALPKSAPLSNTANARLPAISPQGPSVRIPDAGSTPGGLGLPNLPPFMNPGGLNPSIGSNFGDVASRAPFGNGASIGSDGVSADQLGDMLLDGALEAPTGAQDFAF